MLSQNIEPHQSGPSLDTDTADASSEYAQVAAALEEYGHLIRIGTRPDRGEFLARHRRIAHLLSDCLEGFEMVEDAAGHFTAPGTEAEPAGDRSQPLKLGEYRVIREIGRGGMGVVYEAEQLPLGRRVALKVLPWAASLDPRQRQRFQLEAQAAALLHHEHIVPVFGVGTDRGVHYYAMQFVDGRSLTEVIRELRTAPPLNRYGIAFPFERGRTPEPEKRQTPQPGLSDSHPGSRQHWRACARLAAQAALALEHAHEIGVIHRDIKPSNLMLDARNHLWVTDFGLAHLQQGDLGLTPTGDVVGTLRYVSPEQVRGDSGPADARADIYALGATLYELVTLRPAFNGVDRQELLRHILNDEPPRPRRVNPAIPGDLETIILKAMEREPSARYATARELADDLERFLEDQPVQARRPSLVHRALKWGRRHRTVVVATATAVVLTLAASTTFLWRALQASNRALLGQRLTIEYALGAMDQISRSIPEHDPSQATPTLDESAKSILSHTIGFADRIPGMLADIELMKEAVAKAHRQSGRARLLLGERKGRDDYRSAIREYEEFAARNPKLFWLRTDLIATLTEFASLLRTTEDAEDADSLLRRASEIAGSLLSEPEVAKPCYSMALVRAFDDLILADVLPVSDRAFATALAVKLARHSVDWVPARAGGWRVQAVACYRDGELDTALNAVRKSIELNGDSTAADRFLLAAVHQARGDRSKAQHSFEEAMSAMCRETSLCPDRAADLLTRQLRAEAERSLGISN